MNKKINNLKKVEITETLRRVIDVEAESDNEAINIVSEKYKNEEIVLDWGDFVHKNIRVL